MGLAVARLAAQHLLEGGHGRRVPAGALGLDPLRVELGDGGVPGVSDGPRPGAGRPGAESGHEGGEEGARDEGAGGEEERQDERYGHDSGAAGAYPAAVRSSSSTARWQSMQ